MLLVRLQIIATTYRSTIDKTHVFSLYSDLCIFVSMYLYSYPSIQGESGLTAGGAVEQFELRLKMTIKWTQWYAPTPWSREFGDAHRDGYLSYLHWHLEAVMKWT